MDIDKYIKIKKPCLAKIVDQTIHVFVGKFSFTIGCWQDKEGKPKQKNTVTKKTNWLKSPFFR
jgi:hypothetical protein